MKEMSTHLHRDNLEGCLFVELLIDFTNVQMFALTALLVLHTSLFAAAHGGVKTLSVDNRLQVFYNIF